MENGQEIMKEKIEYVKIEHHPETSEDCELFIKKIQEDINELESLSENSHERNRDKGEAFVVREIIEEVEEETESLSENPVSETKEECQVFIKEECQVFINEERQVFINEEHQEAVVPSPRAAVPSSGEEDPLVR
jgi:hypothetical protein